MLIDLSNVAVHFTLLDAFAALFLLLGWSGIGYVIEHSRRKHSTHSLMREYRLKWMREMARRDVRIFDSAMLTTLRQGASFFASACMIAIGGGAALLGQAEQLQSVAGDISEDLSAPRVVWEAKILLMMVLLASGFLKFVWSHRVFGYCAVAMAAVGQSDDPNAEQEAERAGLLQISAAKSFNRGLRALYFALASLVWLLGPVPMMMATLLTIIMLYRREFASNTRSVLLE